MQVIQSQTARNWAKTSDVQEGEQSVNVSLDNLTDVVLLGVLRYELLSVISNHGFKEDALVAGELRNDILNEVIFFILGQCSDNELKAMGGNLRVRGHLEPHQQAIFKSLFPTLVTAVIELVARLKEGHADQQHRVKLNVSLSRSHDLFVEKKVIEGQDQIWLTCLDKNAHPETETKALIFLATPDELDTPIDTASTVFCGEFFDLDGPLFELHDVEELPIAGLTISSEIPQLPLLPFSTPPIDPPGMSLRCDPSEQADVRRLFDAFPDEVDLSADFEKKQLALFSAADCQKTMDVKKLILETPALIHAKKPATGDTLLHIAAANSDILMCEWLFNQGHDTNPVNMNGDTPYNNSNGFIRQLLISRHKGKLCMGLFHPDDVVVFNCTNFQALLFSMGHPASTSAPSHSVKVDGKFRTYFREDYFMMPYIDELLVLEELLRLQYIQRIKPMEASEVELPSLIAMYVYSDVVTTAIAKYPFLGDRMTYVERLERVEAKKMFFYFVVAPLLLEVNTCGKAVPDSIENSTGFQTALRIGHIYKQENDLIMMDEN